jgi:hypothetical protein
MGELINLNQSTDAMMAAHLAATDPHPRYLIERVLALLTQGMLGAAAGVPGGSTAPFDANTWNPNAGQAHASAVNVAAIGIGSGAGNSNLPAGSFPGLILEIDPFLGTAYANFGQTQFFFYYPTRATPYSLWMRQKAFSNSWYAWQRIALDGGICPNGIQIGAGGTPIKKVLSETFTINPPAVAAQSVTGITLSVPGAAVGDFCQVAPAQSDIWLTAIWPFEFPAVVTGPDTVALFLRNDWSGSLDLSPFQVRVVVMGF